MRGADPLPPSPELIGLDSADLAAPRGRAAAQSAIRPLSVASIERRLSGLSWGYMQRGFDLDRKNRHIATVLAGIRRKHARPPVQKEAILPEDIRDMLAALPHELRGLRDRALLLIGFAGGLRRSEIVSLDHGKDDTPDSGGWVQVLEGRALITMRGKTGWREVEIGRGRSDQTCPVHALTQWLHYTKIHFGQIFVAVSRNGLKATSERLSDKHVARLIKRTVEDTGLRPELSNAEGVLLNSGHSLRAGLASNAETDERYVRKQLGHASAEMTRRYQRLWNRFRMNLTKAAGLRPACPIPRLLVSEWIFDRGPCRRKVTDVPGHDGCAMAQRRRRNHQIGVVVTEFCRKSTPDARIFGLKGKQAVREQQDRPITPNAKIVGKLRLPHYLLANATLDFAERYDAQLKVLFSLSLQPGCHFQSSVRATHGQDYVGVEDIHQKFTSRGDAPARGISPPGNAIRWSAKHSRAFIAPSASRWYSSADRMTTAGLPRRVTS